VNYKPDTERFTFGEIQLITVTPAGKGTVTRAAIAIEVRTVAGGWQWELEANTNTGSIMTGSCADEVLATRRQAIDQACLALTEYSNQPIYCSNQGQLPKGWEDWLDKTFGDASRQLQLFQQ
jgi:hypothetical protein